MQVPERSSSAIVAGRLQTYALSLSYQAEGSPSLIGVCREPYACSQKRAHKKNCPQPQLARSRCWCQAAGCAQLQPAAEATLLRR